MWSRKRFTKRFIFALGLVIVLGSASILFADQDSSTEGAPINNNELPQNTVLPPNTWNLSKNEIETKYKSKNIPHPTTVQGSPVSQNSTQQQKIILLEEKKEYQLKGMPNVAPVPVMGTDLAPKSKEASSSASSNTSESQQPLENFVVKARCEINDTVKFSLHKRYVSGTCLLLNAKFRGQRLVDATIELIPDPPQYMAVARVTAIEGTPVTTIRAINSQTYGENVAIVNKRLLANILLASAKDTGSQLSQIIYQDAEEAGSSYSASTTYGTGFGSSTYSSTYPSFQEQMKNIPQAALYLGGANLLNETSTQILGNLKSLPPIFTVVRGTRIRVKFYPYKVNKQSSSAMPSPTTESANESANTTTYQQPTTYNPPTQYQQPQTQYYNTTQHMPMPAPQPYQP